MNKTGKHRGWLLVYEIQYWFFMLVTVIGIMFAPFALASLLGILVVAACWGIPIWSLYRGSTDAVRRGHILWCGILAVLSGTMLFTNPPTATDPAARLGEYIGAIFVVVMWLIWALYWQNSERVKKAYPADSTQEDDSYQTNPDLRAGE